MIEFTEDWMLHPTTLGEGAYGEVKLLINRKTNERVACKIIEYRDVNNAELAVKKEVAMHRNLHHENVIRYYGRRKELLREYIYLEYAENGELFQMIEPGVGMPSKDAQTYMKQLMAGLSYLHSMGIAHRDIKPENLLISAEGTLKICDFGMATVFRWKGKERLLEKRCGTKSYVAPEVMSRSYSAEPADIWSSGIVLVTMLTGELPWHDLNSEDFEAYENNVHLMLTPWRRLTTNSMNLIKKILEIQPEKRYTIRQILDHHWMKMDFDEGINAMENNPNMPSDLLRDVCLSQPVTVLQPSSLNQLVKEVRNRDQLFFSQPVQNEDLIVYSQLACTQSPITSDNFHVLVKRLTRFYVNCSCEKTLEFLCSVLNSCSYIWNKDASGSIVISTVDSKKNPLVFKANIIEMEDKIMIDFRLAKGCGIEFKKKFKIIKDCLSNIVADN